MTCLVKNCKNIRRLMPPDSTVSFHRFPKDENKFRTWLKVLGINNENIKWKDSMFVCSDHFDSGDFLAGFQHHLLKGVAVPHINIGTQEEINLSGNSKNSEELNNVKDEAMETSGEHSYFKAEDDWTDNKSKPLCWICSKIFENEDDCIYCNYQIEGRDDSIKDCLITCVPQLKDFISDADCICHDCVNELVVALGFIEKCLKIQKDQKKLTKQISIPKMEDLTFAVDDNKSDDHNNGFSDNDVNFLDGSESDFNLKNDFFIGFKQSCLGTAFSAVQSKLIKCGVDLIKTDVNSKNEKKIFFVASTNVEKPIIGGANRKVTYACLQCVKNFENQVEYLQHCDDTHNKRAAAAKRSSISTITRNALKFVELEDQKYLVFPETAAIISAAGLQNTFPEFHIDLAKEGVKTVRLLGGSTNQNKRIIFLGTWQTEEDTTIGKRGVFRCIQCPKMFIYEGDYFMHYKEVHLHQCAICSKAFDSEKLVTSHVILEHNPNQTYECNKCNRKFSRRSTFAIHQESFKDSPTCTAKCPECKALFYSMARFRDHMNEQMCKKVSSFKLEEVLCEQCGKQFNCPKKLKMHTKNVHELSREFMCQKCGKICRGMQNFRNHMYTHDPNRVRTIYMCDQCPKKFIKKAGMLSHRAKFHENRILYKCEPCNKSFVTNSGLKTHNRHFHQKMYPYTCQICLEGFARSDYLNRHLRAHDRLGDEENLIATGKRQRILRQNFYYPGQRKKYLCEAPCLCKICNKMFSAATIKQHYRTHVKFRPHRCSYCPNSFTSYQNCKRHEKRHADPSYNLQCHICFNKFRKSFELEMHMQKHQDKMRYSCNVCGKRFGRVYMLENHKVHEHPDIMEKREEIYNELIKEIVHVIQPGEEDDYIVKTDVPFKGYKIDLDEAAELQKALDQLEQEY